MSEFNEVGREVYSTLEKTAKHILRALALYLNIEEDYFDKYIKNGNSILRPIHYPPILEDPKEAVRASAHGDINLITLLIGAEEGGLEIQKKDKEWIKVVPSSKAIVCNIGDMMQLVTDKKLKSTTHRVIQELSLIHI